MSEFLGMTVLILLFVAAPFLFVYGAYKLTDIGGGLFAGSFVCIWYAIWIAMFCAEMGI